MQADATGSSGMRDAAGYLWDGRTSLLHSVMSAACRHRTVRAGRGRTKPVMNALREEEGHQGTAQNGHGVARGKPRAIRARLLAL
jgi:hypothetical protein